MWKALIFLGPVVSFIYLLVALVHCATSDAHSLGKRILIIFFMLISGIGALVYGLSRSQPPWLRSFTRITMALMIMSTLVMGLYVRQLKSDMLENLGKPLMPDAVRLTVPKTLPSDVPDFNGKIKAYHYLVRINQNSMILTSFAKDQSLFKQGTSARSALCEIAPMVAGAYEKSGDNKKAAYYWALSAKLRAEQNPGHLDVRRYMGEAVRLDPSSAYVQQVKKSLNL
jgi:hypothetical protein